MALARWGLMMATTVAVSVLIPIALSRPVTVASVSAVAVISTIATTTMTSLSAPVALLFSLFLKLGNFEICLVSDGHFIFDERYVRIRRPLTSVFSRF